MWGRRVIFFSDLHFFFRKSFFFLLNNSFKASYFPHVGGLYLVQFTMDSIVKLSSTTEP